MFIFRKITALVRLIFYRKQPAPHEVIGGVDVDLLETKAALFLRDIYLKTVEFYSEVETDFLVERCKTNEQRRYAGRILGEHYKLLPALAKAINAKKVIEIGSATGMSAIQLRHYGFEVTCFDIFEWDKIENSLLTIEDFADGKLKWIISDLSVQNNFNQHKNLLQASDLIFVDAPKDGIFEYILIPKLLDLAERNPNLMIVIDDIYFRNMQSLWFSLGPGRLDFTFLGHTSGTGVVFPRFCK